MADTDDPFRSVRSDAAAAARRGPARRAGADVRRADLRGRVEAEPMPDRGARLARPRPESAGPGGQPAAAADRPAARRAVGDGRRRAAPARARRDPPVRGAGARGGRAQRDRPGGALRAVRRRSTKRCSRRRGARRASGRSTRCWSRCTARRGAARSSSRCSIDLGRSGAPHRPDGAAVPAPRARLHRQVPDARPRTRAAGRPAARACIARSAASAGRRRRSCRCAGAASRIGATG